MLDNRNQRRKILRNNFLQEKHETKSLKKMITYFRTNTVEVRKLDVLVSS